MAEQDQQTIWYKRGRRAGFVEGLVVAMVVALCAGVWWVQTTSTKPHPPFMEQIDAVRPDADPD